MRPELTTSGRWSEQHPAPGNTQCWLSVVRCKEICSLTEEWARRQNLEDSFKQKGRKRRVWG